MRETVFGVYLFALGSKRSVDVHLAAFVRFSCCHLSVNYCKQAEVRNVFPIVAKCHSWWETLKVFEKSYNIDNHTSYRHDNRNVSDDRTICEDIFPQKVILCLGLADICVMQP